MSELAPEGAPVEPTEPVQEPGFAVSPEEWQATQERLAQFEQILQPPPPPWQQQPQGPPVPDPFAENYAEQFQHYTEALMAPYAQFQQQVQLAEAEERGMEILSQHAQTIGEFDREMAWARANQLIYQFGSDPRAAERALEQAAKETRDYERRVGEQYHQQQLEQLQTAAGAPRGLPAGQAGAQTLGVGSYGNVPNAVTNRMFGRG